MDKTYCLKRIHKQKMNGLCKQQEKWKSLRKKKLLIDELKKEKEIEKRRTEEILWIIKKKERRKLTKKITSISTIFLIQNVLFFFWKLLYLFSPTNFISSSICTFYILKIDRENENKREKRLVTLKIYHCNRPHLYSREFFFETVEKETF